MKPISIQRLIRLKPIGFVRTESTEAEIKENKSEVISEIVVTKEFSNALDGIEEYSHIFVLYFMHRIPKDHRGIMKVHPRGRTDMPLVGVFATRTAYRPNPIGLTLVKLLERRETILKVKGLDALHGTPVLDIKSYDLMDIAEDVKVPEWWIKLKDKQSTDLR